MVGIPKFENARISSEERNKILEEIIEEEKRRLKMDDGVLMARGEKRGSTGGEFLKKQKEYSDVSATITSPIQLKINEIVDDIIELRNLNRNLCEGLAAILYPVDIPQMDVEKAMEKNESILEVQLDNILHMLDGERYFINELITQIRV